MGIKTWVKLLLSKSVLENFGVILIVGTLATGGYFLFTDMNQKVDSLLIKGITTTTLTPKPTYAPFPTNKVIKPTPTVKVRTQFVQPTPQPTVQPTSNLVNCWNKEGSSYKYNYGVITKEECDAKLQADLDNMIKVNEAFQELAEERKKLEAINQQIHELQMQQLDRDIEEAHQGCLDSCYQQMINRVQSGYYGNPDSEATPELEAQIIAHLEACKSECN